jgi:hypothetical protein
MVATRLITAEVYYRDLSLEELDSLDRDIENRSTEWILRNLEQYWKRMFLITAKDDKEWDELYTTGFVDPIPFTNRDIKICEDIFQHTNSPYGNLFRSEKSRIKLLTEFSHWHRSNMDIGDIISITRYKDDRYHNTKSYYILYYDRRPPLRWGTNISN